MKNNDNNEETTKFKSDIGKGTNDEDDVTTITDDEDFEEDTDVITDEDDEDDVTAITDVPDCEEDDEDHPVHDDDVEYFDDYTHDLHDLHHHDLTTLPTHVFHLLLRPK